MHKLKDRKCIIVSLLCVITIFVSTFVHAVANNLEIKSNIMYESQPAPIVFPEDKTQFTENVVRYSVDFSYLKTVAPDSVAWLFQPNLTINNPILHSSNFKKYFNRHYNNKLNSNGSLSIQHSSTPDFDDPVIAIHGKNNKNLSMFGSFSLYVNRNYYLDNSSFYLLTPHADYRLDIFAGFHESKSLDTWINEALEHKRFTLESLKQLMNDSFIKSKNQFLPNANDDIAILIAENTLTYGQSIILFARKRSIIYNTSKVQDVNKIEMDMRETQSYSVSLPEIGNKTIYSQNNSLWGDLIFESSTSQKYRPFKDGGCGPTAIAIAIANLVDKSELTKLNNFALSPAGFTFCTCSVNDFWCSHNHVKYKLDTADEFYRYLPIVIANYATGNNTWKIRGRSENFGSSLLYLPTLCEIFDITISKSPNIYNTLDLLKNRNSIALASVTGIPFTNRTHFLLIVGSDKEYLYVIDPLRRDNYDLLDKQRILEIVSPGLVRVKLENAEKCGFKSVFVLEKNENILQVENN